MKTTQYTVARVTVQTFSAIMIIASIAMGVYIYLSDIDKVESLLNIKPLVMFFDIGLCISSISILYGLFTALSITSKSKLLMKFNEKFLYTQIGLVLSATIYFRFFYINSLISSLSAEFIPSNAGFTALLCSYNLVPVNGSLVTAFGVYVEWIINIFCGAQILVAILAYVQAKILNYTTRIELEKPDEVIPNVIDAKDLGCYHAMSYRMPIGAQAS